VDLQARSCRGTCSTASCRGARNHLLLHPFHQMSVSRRVQDRDVRIAPSFLLAAFDIRTAGGSRFLPHCTQILQGIQNKVNGRSGRHQCHRVLGPLPRRAAGRRRRSIGGGGRRRFPSSRATKADISLWYGPHTVTRRCGSTVLPGEGAPYRRFVCDPGRVSNTRTTLATGITASLVLLFLLFLPPVDIKKPGHWLQTL
jgi:hypothetical protein